MAVLENPRHEIFAQAVVSGKTQTDAYREAFPNSLAWKDTSVAPKASNLASKPDVAARILELQSQASCDAILSRQDRMIILTNIATDSEQPTRHRINAIDVLNKMNGDYVKKVEATIKNDFAHTASDIEAILDED